MYEVSRAEGQKLHACTKKETLRLHFHEQAKHGTQGLSTNKQKRTSAPLVCAASNSFLCDTSMLLTICSTQQRMCLSVFR